MTPRAGIPALLLLWSATLAFGGLYPDTISPSTVPWPGGVVPYAFDAGLSAAQRQIYLSGLREYELAANVQFADATTRGNFGGSEAGAANVIAGNTSNGIALYESATAGHVFSRNSIYGNGWRGITLNDGSNGGQIAPDLTSAILGVTTHVTGSLNGSANGSYDLEFFSSDGAIPPSGRHFIGSASITADGSGVATIDLVLPAPIPAGRVITTTARSAGGTSEFSNGVTVATTDSDGDGLPDAYEGTIPGLSPANAADAVQDLDGDGFSNLDEFLAGTAPGDPASRLFATGVRSGGDFTVSFPSVSGQIYQIDTAASLAGPWLSEAIHLFGTGGIMSVVMPVSGPRRFFRVIAGP